ncbi:dihydropteroate synthase [Horticoccus luteus]|uniref:dihydropteroate synthase n=1 Tax=Horticoccus luteus TaxID=2862869 RepID=A0A8F9TT04_9BACT|nr:dihydropteroate synthase [Horticoccus luteus]QYM78510.1 dihydropteroate synthase [Horticoccus luteus]
MQVWQSPHGRPLPVPGARTLLMGVLNVTPDSFSDGGQLSSLHALVDRAGAMLAAGANLLDLGGESTRPGALTISAAEECDRVLPAIAALRRAWPAVPLSIDTYKAEVAEAALAAGADLINDVWGFTHGLDAAQRTAWRAYAESSARRATSPALSSAAPAPSPLTPPPLSPMAEVAARLRAPAILMHNRPDRAYDDFWADLLLDLRTSLALARAAGVPDRQLWLDPGFGFAKDVAQNLAVLRDLHRIVALGFPVLVGTSRKSTLGAVLGTRVDDRVEAGGATVVWAIQQGAAMVRVHDVHEMARFARMADAIKSGLGFTPV